MDGYTTMSSEFNLYCQRGPLRDTTISIMYSGVVFGNMAIGLIGDILGRRKTIILTWAIGTLMIIGLSLAPSFMAVEIMMFMAGFFAWPPLNVSIIMAN
jgi:MFS family permease